MDNPQAFPHLEPRDPTFSYCDNGMTLLDYFAGQALAGFCANPNGLEWPFDEMAGDAYRIARAMLTARKEATDDTV